MSLFQQLLDNSAKVVSADVDLGDLSLSVDQEESGNRARLEALGDRALRRFTHRHAPGQFRAGDEGLHRLRALVEADAHDLQSLLVEFPVKLLEIGELGQAGSAIGGPEVDEQCFSG